MIIGITGKSGAGKDEVAKVLVQDFLFVRVGLADPIKRILKDVFDFSDEQLWGSLKNEPDKRYVSSVTNASHMLSSEGFKQYPDGEVPQYLTPRHAMQQLGTEFGRHCYSNVWVDHMVRTATKLLAGPYGYDPKTGLLPGAYTKAAGVVVPDVRFKNEADAIRRAGGVVWRVLRDDNTHALQGSCMLHASEQQQDAIEVELTLANNDSLEELRGRVWAAARKLLLADGEAHQERSLAARPQHRNWRAHKSKC